LADPSEARKPIYAPIEYLPFSKFPESRRSANVKVAAL
jgi:hypothetical protein